MRMPRLRLGYFAIGVIGVLLTTSVVVGAGIVGGVITACYNLSTGVLRVETTTAPCIIAGNPILTRAPLLREERLDRLRRSMPLLPRSGRVQQRPA